MEQILWIETTDLKWWASTRDCRGNLPLLIRNLIRATVSNISHILFPAREGVGSPGWDGILESSESNEYIPDGVSVWEMSCNSNVRTKANTDYEKRKEDIKGMNPSETTYICVTPRKFNNKDDWCEEKKQEGFWKDVRVYDADNLEDWISQAPTVGLWLGQNILGKYPAGIISLIDWFNEWKTQTSPPLTSKLVSAGRDDQVKLVHELLKSTSKITVQASTIDESIAFLAAVIDSMPEEERDFYLSRSIVVGDSEALKHISTTGRKGLLLIPKFAEFEGISLAIQKGHNVYLSVGPDNTVSNPDVILTRWLRKDAFISALEEVGISKEDAEKYSRDTGRNLTVFRRQLTSEANQPGWAKADSARDIIPALLSGQWKETNDEDKRIIGQIAGEPYESYSRKLYLWQKQPDSPVLRVGESWRLVSAMDAFSVLASFMTPDDLQNFKEIALMVLGSLDPTLDLEPEKRWMAAVYGKVPLYSNDLRKGIVQTLILIAVFGDDLKLPLTMKAQSWVDNVIRELLKDADCDLWNSITDVLPLIAEASPTSFMSAVEYSLSRDEKPIMCLFGEIQGITGPSSNHSSLLWALEHLAWSPELLSRVTIILGKLAKYDPNSESRMINRPMNSLREIFLLWHPQTDASLKIRLEVLDVLIERYPEVGWHLLIDLLPRDHDVGHPTSKAMWRQFSEKTEVPVTIAEHYASVKEIIDRLSIHVGYDGQRWVKILDHFAALPADQRNRIVEQLASSADKVSAGRYELWNKLREIISRHRSYPESDWSLPEEELQVLEEIYFTLEPDDKIDRFSWLFDGWPNLLKGVRIEDRHDDDEKFVQLRLEALNEIREEYGFEGLIKLAEKIERPQYIGQTLAEDDIDAIEEEKLYSLLDGEDESKMVFVKEYILRKAFNDEDWIENLVKKAQNENWPNLRIVNLFTAFLSRMFVWNLLKTFDKGIQEAYWRKCGFGGITKESEDKIYYVKQMVQAKRYFTALDIAALYAKEMPTELIAEILEKAAIEKSEDEFRIEYYDVERLFKELYESDHPENEIAKLEWYYLPFLVGVGRDKQTPKLLHNELSSNPEFFAEIMRHIYKREDEKQDEDEGKLSQELLKQRVNLSTKLLLSWNKIPGSKDNSQIDFTKLKSWVAKARELCEKSDRLAFCDIQIGKLLAHAEPENDLWPPESVCKIIEGIESEELHRGFNIGITNKRGVFTKSLDEGGKQEIALANKFRGYADNLNTRFPKTASILYHVAEDYENQAKREDNEVEIRDLDY